MSIERENDLESNGSTQPKLRRLRKIGVVFLALFVAYRVFVFAYNYNSPFTWGVPWVGSAIVHKLVSAERDEHQGDEAYWLEVLDESNTGAFQRPALGDSDAVRTGKQLPDAFYFTDSPSCPISRIHLGDRLLFDGTIVVRSTRELYHFRRINAALVSLLDQSSPSLVEWLAARSDTLPPQRLDALIYYSFVGVPWPEPSSPFWVHSRSDWRRMASGKNPVSRLRALQTAHFWCETADELTDVYRTALDEQNSIFHSTVLGGMRAMASERPENRKEFEPFSGTSEQQVRALFRGPWSQIVHDFEKDLTVTDDGTLGGWDLLPEIPKTLDYLAKAGSTVSAS